METNARLVTVLTLALVACGGDATGSQTSPLVGWTPRFDVPEQESVAGRFREQADGLEVGAGPNATLWHSDSTATGNFRLSLDVTHLDSGLHPHGAGLTFGGSDVHGDAQRYTYFLVRCDRNFLIKTRAGEESPTLVPWTEHVAVAPEDEAGVTRNRLVVEARSEDVRFLVNGAEVHRARRSEVQVEGRYGVRLVHDLHVKFGKPLVERLE